MPGGSGRTRSQSAASSTTASDRKSTRLNSSHSQISYAVFCLKKKKLPPDKAFLVREYLLYYAKRDVSSSSVYKYPASTTQSSFHRNPDSHSHNTHTDLLKCPL